MAETDVFTEAFGVGQGMAEVKKTILVVDDDPYILRVFRRVFEKKGYAVTTAGTYRDALHYLRQNRFNAALLDVRLPDMDGTRLLPVIREASPGAVRIVFTGSPPEEFANGCLDKSVDAFLVKPVKPEVLLGILDEKLKTK
ncbi:MAG: response regulator [Candidatus Bathyarchaeia archaeon]